MNPLLEVQGVTVCYETARGIIRAVDNVSFTLRMGEALGIVGESGSGKTSLALHLMRLLPRNTVLSEGKIFVEGIECSALPETEFRRRVRWRLLSMVFQGALEALNPVVQVGEQVAEPLFLDGVLSKKEVRHRVQETLAQVALPPEIYDRYPHELSGGMKQRVIIAMALILGPRVIILDEPTSALDVSIQAQIMNLLKELKDKLGLSSLFITHDIALASDLCDTIGVLYAGELVELGPAEAVLRQPQHPYTEGLLSSLPRLRSPAHPRPIKGAPPNPFAPPPGCPFHPRCPYIFEPCRQKTPAAFAVAAGHIACCWLRELHDC